MWPTVNESCTSDVATVHKGYKTKCNEMNFSAICRLTTYSLLLLLIDWCTLKLRLMDFHIENYDKVVSISYPNTKTIATQYQKLSAQIQVLFSEIQTWKKPEVFR